MYEYLTDEDKKLISLIANYDCDDLIKDIQSQPKPIIDDIFSVTKMCFYGDLNKKGLQLLRELLSNRINEARQDYRAAAYDADLIKEWREKGAIILNNIFSESDVNPDGSLKTNDDFITIMRMTLGDNSVPTYNSLYAQSIDSYRGNDVQCNSHFDTYHPSVKVWVYMTDITLDHAPFCIKKATHYPTEKRLRFMYDLSNRLKSWDEYKAFVDHNLDFGDPEPVLGGRFTTIIANVAAFHKRGNGKLGFKRSVARGNLDRKNPYRPIEID